MEKNIEKQLSHLLELQDLDNQLQDILDVKGEGPQQIKILTDKLADLEQAVSLCEEEQANLQKEVSALHFKITDNQQVIKRCESQQVNIRNNREYDALTKEIELYHLDIQLAEKKVREHYDQLERNKHKLTELKKVISQTQADLKEKEEELQALTGNNKEETILVKKRQSLKNLIDHSLFQLYEKIRGNVRNKLAVVLVKRGACGGCFTTVYPQMQAEIKEKRQISKCEHCGRILADVADPVIVINPLEEVVNE